MLFWLLIFFSGITFCAEDPDKTRNHKVSMFDKYVKQYKTEHNIKSLHKAMKDKDTRKKILKGLAQNPYFEKAIAQGITHYSKYHRSLFDSITSFYYSIKSGYHSFQQIHPEFSHFVKKLNNELKQDSIIVKYAGDIYNTRDDLDRQSKPENARWNYAIFPFIKDRIFGLILAKSNIDNNTAQIAFLLNFSGTGYHSYIAERFNLHCPYQESEDELNTVRAQRGPGAGTVIELIDTPVLDKKEMSVFDCITTVTRLFSCDAPFVEEFTMLCNENRIKEARILLSKKFNLRSEDSVHDHTITRETLRSQLILEKIAKYKKSE